MLSQSNSPRAVDSGNLGAPAEPEDADGRLQAAWLAQISTSVDAGLTRQIPPEQDSGSPNTSHSDVQHAQEFPLASRSRSGVITIVLLVAIAVVVVAAVVLIAISLPRNDVATPRLMVEPSIAAAGEPAPIKLAVRGEAKDAVVIIRGLVPGMELSAGSAVGRDGWELPVKDLSYAWIAPPQDFVGSVDLAADLWLPSAQIADRKTVHLEWTRTATAPQQQQKEEQTSVRKENDPAPPIAPPTVQDHSDRATAAPPISADPSRAQSARDQGKRSRPRAKDSSPRSSVNQGSASFPSAMPRVDDTRRAVKGFWDWSR